MVITSLRWLLAYSVLVVAKSTSDELVSSVADASSACRHDGAIDDTIGNTEEIKTTMKAFREMDTAKARRANLKLYEMARSHCVWVDQNGPRRASIDYMWWESDADLKADYWGDLLSWTMTGGAQVQEHRLVQSLRWWYYHGFGGHAAAMPERPLGSPPVTSQLCVVPASYSSAPSIVDGDDTGSQDPNYSDKQEEEWRILRVGPLIGRGGFDWHRLGVPDAFGLVHAADENTVDKEKWYVTANFLAPVSAAPATSDQQHQQHVVLANPPVHIHHANVNPRHAQTNFSRIAQWHGDSQCLDEDGGPACYLRTLPSGYGFPLMQAPVASPSAPFGLLDLDADLNDVRPAGSEPLPFYLEAAVRIRRVSAARAPTDDDSRMVPSNDTSAIKETGVLILGTPARFDWYKSTDFAGTYYVPTDRASALWCTTTLPVTGVFASGHIYTHQMILDHAWVIVNASPRELGLNQGPFQMEKPWMPWTPRDLGWASESFAMEALGQQIITSLDQLRLQCHRNDVCDKPPRLLWNLNETVVEHTPGGETKSRQMAWPAEPWELEQGQQYTVIVFHKALTSSKGKHKGKDKMKATSWMQQHLAIHGNYVQTRHHQQPAEYHYVLPTNDNPQNTWVDAPNPWTLLLRFGGPIPFWCTKTVLIVGLMGVLGLVFALYALRLAAWVAHGITTSHFPSRVQAYYASLHTNMNDHDNLDGVPAACSEMAPLACQENIISEECCQFDALVPPACAKSLLSGPARSFDQMSQSWIENAPGDDDNDGADISSCTHHSSVSVHSDNTLDVPLAGSDQEEDPFIKTQSIGIPVACRGVLPFNDHEMHILLACRDTGVNGIPLAPACTDSSIPQEGANVMERSCQGSASDG